MPIPFDEDIPLDNKQIRLYDSSYNFTRISVDELIAQKLNYWKGWYCSAGERSLYVDYDGRVWISNCASSNYYKKEWLKYMWDSIGQPPHKEWHDKNTPGGWDMVNRGPGIPGWNFKDSEYHRNFMKHIAELEEAFYTSPGTGVYDEKIKEEYFGYIGNIYDKLVFDDISWVKCPFDSCGCGADVFLSKIKDEKYLDSLAVSKHGYEGQNRTKKNFVKNIDDSVSMELNFPINYQVLWDLGRRCNYNCNYCWNGVHSPTEKHHSYDVIKGTIKKIINDWARNNEVRWNFGGGEPTIHPNFLDIVKFLKENNQWVMLVSNGSRENNYWKELRKYCNSVLFSAHFESMAKFERHEARFIENINLVMDWHNSHDDDHWLEIKLMAPPGYVHHAVEFKNKIDLNELNSPGKNGRMKGCCSIVPIRLDTVTAKNKMYDENDIRAGIDNYTSEELKILENQ